MPRAIFLDKDGTLVDDVPYNVDPTMIQLAWQAGPALQLLQAQGYRLIVVSNQSGVARGLFMETALEGVHKRLSELLAQYGVRLDGFYYCPHHPQGSVQRYAIDCTCRKPLPGMLLRAAHEHRIELAESWMVGDILNDVEAGHRAGCRSVLIDNGNETEWKRSALREPEISAPDLMTAAQSISAFDRRPAACKGAIDTHSRR